VDTTQRWTSTTCPPLTPAILYSGAVRCADIAQRRDATPDDQYLWFSMTKIATATAAMRLHRDGLLDLDAPVGCYLSGYRPHPEHGHPTTRQLLRHTASPPTPTSDTCSPPR
jgi:CubicO group peptidase (beta-lactamase class C family)